MSPVASRSARFRREVEAGGRLAHVPHAVLPRLDDGASRAIRWRVVHDEQINRGGVGRLLGITLHRRDDAVEATLQQPGWSRVQTTNEIVGAAGGAGSGRPAASSAVERVADDADGVRTSDHAIELQPPRGACRARTVS